MEGYLFITTSWLWDVVCNCADSGLTKVEELQEEQAISEDSAAESGSNSGLGKNLMQEDDLKPSYALDAPVHLNIFSLHLQPSRDIFLCDIDAIN